MLVALINNQGVCVTSLKPRLLLAALSSTLIRVDNEVVDLDATDWELERNGVSVAVVESWPYDDPVEAGVSYTYRARRRVVRSS